jgi:xanthine dehydrogenase YagS FAD-binding subunit
MAGGTDIFGGEMKDNLIAPERVVHIRHIKELQGIRTGRGSIRIGTSTLLSDIVESDVVQQRAPLLAMAAGHVGTVQIRNMGTIGGNLCQRPRCWYYRNNYPCYKHGGNICFSATGENDFNAILLGGPSFIVHPSDTAPALVALGATARIVDSSGRERTVTMDKFFVTPREDVRRENVLQPNEILVELQVPDTPAGSRAVYM